MIIFYGTNFYTFWEKLFIFVTIQNLILSEAMAKPTRYLDLTSIHYWGVLLPNNFLTKSKEFSQCAIFYTIMQRKLFMNNE